MTESTALLLVPVAADPGQYTAAEVDVSARELRRLRDAGLLYPCAVRLLPAGQAAAEDGSELYGIRRGTGKDAEVKPNLLGQVLALLLEDEDGAMTQADIARALGHASVSSGLKQAVQTGVAFGYLTDPSGLMLTESGLCSLNAWPDVRRALVRERRLIDAAVARNREKRIKALREEIAMRVEEIRRLGGDVLVGERGAA